MANAAKGASLNPADFGGGAIIPDGRYTITSARAVMFDYGGQYPAGPALELTFNDGQQDYVQNYSAGKPEFLEPNQDETGFVHPNGEDAKIAKNSNVSQFITALVNAGFPPTELQGDVRCFVKADLDIVNQAQEKRPGLKDQKEGKTIPLPAKYHGRAKAGAKGRPTPARGAGTAAKTAAATATASPSNNGDLDAEAIMRVQEALTGAKDNTLNRVKLQLTVWQLANKAKDANATEYRKLAGNVDWLDANAEAGSWLRSGDEITLAV